MLPARTEERPDALALFKEEYYRKLIQDYDLRVKPGTQHYGVRYLYYHEPDNTLLVSHSWGSRVHLINLSTGSIRYYDFHKQTVRMILVHNNEIITASWDGTVRVVDYFTLKERLRLSDPEMGRSPCATVRESGDSLIAFCYDSDKKPECRSNKVRLWSLSEGLLKMIYHETGEHRASMRSGYCLNHGSNLYVISNSGYLNVFRLGSGRMVSSTFLALNLRAMCIHPSRKLIIVGDETGMIYVCRLDPVFILFSIKGHHFDISEIRMHDSREDIIITIAFDGRIKFWKLPSFTCECEIVCGNSMLWTQTMRKDLVFAGSDEGDIWIWDIHDLPNYRLKGRMRVFSDSILVRQDDSKYFYSNDISNLELLEKDKQEPISGKPAEYLLHSFNKESVLNEVFRSDQELKEQKPNAEKLVAQLPQSIS